MNAYTEGSRVHLDFGVGKVSQFAFIREATNIQIKPEEMAGDLVRWTFDLSKPGEQWDETILGPGGDMPRVADKNALIDYDVAYYQTYDPTVAPPLIAGPVGRRLQHDPAYRAEERQGATAANGPALDGSGARAYSLEDPGARGLPRVPRGPAR